MDKKMEDYINELGNNFIGLWRYKRYDRPIAWCVTICHNGENYDLDEKPTINEAFEEAIKLLKKLENE